MASVVKPFTFSAGAVILSAEHNSNFNTIYDDYNGNITNANISASAAIANAKLNLASIAQNIAISGDLTLTGTANDFSGATFSDGGTVTTIDINGGTIDGTNIGATTQGTGHVSTLKVGTTNQGDILYDNGTSLVRLTPGTSGDFLQTQGAAANPQWATASGAAWTFVQSSTFSAVSSSSITQTISSGDLYKIIWEGTVSGSVFTSPCIRINNDSVGNQYDRMFSQDYSTSSSAATTLTDSEGGQNEIKVLDGVTVDNLGFSTNGNFKLEANITARNSDTQVEWIISCTSDIVTTAPSFIRCTGVATFDGATPTSIQFLRLSGSHTITGRFYVQKAATS